MQQRATFDTIYGAKKRPTSAFGYQPAIDFYDELVKVGDVGLSVAALAERLRARGWHRPQGGELTNEIMRIDLVSMCKHGFVERLLN